MLLFLEAFVLLLLLPALFEEEGGTSVADSSAVLLLSSMLLPTFLIREVCDSTLVSIPSSSTC